MLQQRIYAYRSGWKGNYNSQQDELPELKNAFPEYRSIHSLVVQDVAHRMDRSYDNFYRRIGERKEGKQHKGRIFTIQVRRKVQFHHIHAVGVQDNGKWSCMVIKNR